MGMIQRLIDEHNKNPLWSMEFREAVPVIMEKLGIGAAEALAIWMRHQVVVPVEPEEMGINPDEEDGGKVYVFWNDKDVIVFEEPGPEQGRDKGVKVKHRGRGRKAA